MKPTFGLFVALLIVIATGLIVYSAIGIARNADDPAAGATVQALGTALEAGDGERACSLFTQDVQDEIERSRRKPCDQGILELREDIAPDGDPARVNSAENSSLVRMSGGDAYFLDKTPAGWRLSAAGCEPRIEVPYECEVQG